MAKQNPEKRTEARLRHETDIAMGRTGAESVCSATPETYRAGIKWRKFLDDTLLPGPLTTR
jgi:hypothetical protein